MVISSVFAFLHFLAVVAIFATVFLEWQTFSRWRSGSSCFSCSVWRCARASWLKASGSESKA